MEMGLLLQQLSGADLKRRDQAALQLREQAAGGLGAPVLVDALQHKRGRVRREAARALGVMRAEDASVLEALSGLLLERSDKLKKAAAWALGRVGPVATACVLGQLPAASRHSQGWICQALGQIGDRSALEALRELHAQAQGFVEREAVRALGRIDFQATLHELTAQARMGWDEDGRVQKAQRGLLELGSVVPDPIELIEDAAMSQGDALTAFEISQGKGNRHLAQGAIRAMGERRHRPAISALLDALESDIYELQEEALVALQKLGGPESLRGAARGLSNPRNTLSTRQLCARLLGSLKQPEALDALAACILDDESPSELRQLAAEQSHRCDVPARLLPRLIELLCAHTEAQQEREISALQRALIGSMTRLAAQKVPLSYRLGWLRDLFSHPPHPALLAAAEALAAQWPDDEDPSLALDYIAQHRDDWSQRGLLLED